MLQFLWKTSWCTSFATSRWRSLRRRRRILRSNNAFGTGDSRCSCRYAADEESSEIPSTSSSSSSSSDGEDMPAAQNDIPGPVWRNRRSHVVHRCSQSTRSTACGRLVTSSNFELLEEGCSSLNARCGKCFKGEVISSVGGLIAALDQQRAKRPRR